MASVDRSVEWVCGCESDPSSKMDWNEAKKSGLGRFTFEIRVRGFRVLSQLERRLSCHVPGSKSAHPAVPVTNTQLCIMRIMLNDVLCKGQGSVSNPTYLRSNPRKPPFPKKSEAWVPFIILSLRTVCPTLRASAETLCHAHQPRAGAVRYPGAHRGRHAQV